MATSDVDEVIRLEPHAGLVDSIGAHHTFESAIADLVDNAIDAGATKVTVRLLTRHERLAQVEVLDNGIGMDAVLADRAMTIGYQREYGAQDLGHFGVGMKAASFAHSDVLTVWSKSESDDAVGRRIRRADFAKDFSCEVLTLSASQKAMRARKKIVGRSEGTSVIWTELRSVYPGTNAEEARTWLATKERDIRSHLGVTFHRLIEKRLATIEIIVDDIRDAANAIGTSVAAIDPFGYATSGRPGYPKVITAKSGGNKVNLACHIWPPKKDIPGFRIGGKAGDKLQGFYVYRNDRLLQIGGWAHVSNASPKRQLARVVIDDEESIGTFLAMNPEKSGLKFEPLFGRALAQAVADDGTTFEQYLKDAEETHAEGNRRTSKRARVIAPDRGFSPSVRKVVKEELPLRSDKISIVWKNLPKGEFFDISYGERTILLNKKYRYLFSPGGGSLNDAPVIKSLMFLLAHGVFEGAYLGPKDKDNLLLWRSILGGAVLAEEEMRGKAD